MQFLALFIEPRPRIAVELWRPARKMKEPPEITHGYAKDHTPPCCEGQAVAPATAWATSRNGEVKFFWPVSDSLQRFFLL